MYKSHYCKFLSANPKRLHFAAHSHHYWLDVTRDAHMQYWDDSAKYADQKWNHIFSSVIPTAQESISKILNLSHPEQIAFAPNTHEFVNRLLSCFENQTPIRILTTDSEFHSFSRQIARLEEANQVVVTRIPAEPFATFESRLIDAIRKSEYDLIFFSHVFFNSGYVVQNLESVVNSVKRTETMIVIDGYHSFCAIPFSMKPIEHRVFYLAGGYKYAQAGEGVCFLCVPKGSPERPVNTGWYAEFGKLAEKKSGEVGYSDDGFRFFGATFDPSGLYRWNAVANWMHKQNLTIEKIHSYIQSLQEEFLNELVKSNSNRIPITLLIPSEETKHRGHFLTFDLPKAEEVEIELLKHDIVVDRRGSRLRFGLGLYHDSDDVKEFFVRLNSIEH